MEFTCTKELKDYLNGLPNESRTLKEVTEVLTEFPEDIGVFWVSNERTYEEDQGFDIDGVIYAGKDKKESFPFFFISLEEEE